MQGKWLYFFVVLFVTSLFFSGGSVVSQSRRSADPSATRRQQQAELSLRIGRLEGALRQIHGKIEQIDFQVKQLSQLMDRMQQDYELRLQIIEAGSASSSDIDAGISPQEEAGSGNSFDVDAVRPRETAPVNSTVSEKQGDDVSPPREAIPTFEPIKSPPRRPVR